jgi:hypothetical protein
VKKPSPLIGERVRVRGKQTGGRASWRAVKKPSPLTGERVRVRGQSLRIIRLKLSPNTRNPPSRPRSVGATCRVAPTLGLYAHGLSRSPLPPLARGELEGGSFNNPLTHTLSPTGGEVFFSARREARPPEASTGWLGLYANGISRLGSIPRSGNFAL